MIPASYLFKQTYRQYWEDAAELPTKTEDRTRFINGLMTPIAGAIHAVLHRPAGHALGLRTGGAKSSW